MLQGIDLLTSFPSQSQSQAPSNSSSSTKNDFFQLVMSDHLVNQAEVEVIEQNGEELLEEDSNRLRQVMQELFENSDIDLADTDPTALINGLTDLVDSDKTVINKVMEKLIVAFENSQTDSSMPIYPMAQAKTEVEQNSEELLDELLAFLTEKTVEEETFYLSEEDKQRLGQLLQGIINDTDTELIDTNSTALIDELAHLLDSNKTVINKVLEKLRTALEDSQTDAPTPIYPMEIPMLQSISNVQEASKEKLDKLIVQTEQVLVSISDHSNKAQNYKQILQLLEQWSKLDSKTQLAAQVVLSESVSENNKDIWSTLLTNFMNRQSIDQQYSSSQKVTQVDIKRWLQNAVDKNDTVNQSRMDHVNQPLQSKVQQYTIHLSLTNTDEQLVQKQLLDQFQQVMKNSQFMKLSNGTNQLMLRIQPDQLGEVTVKLLQVNGEMTVKMIASSQHAKELLEGNLHQLRHLFSPHQIQIEKQESYGQVEQDNLLDDDQAEDSNAQQQEHEDNDQANADTQDELSFEDLLVNAKV
ncbi:flagellar hook-length control protein FliK [Gracilibacillus sp. S3-1-1]|uniref:Flagellar hook-length control protein FliK n=1 Tax=Gracilibacillus pellucidus TaxID=3095368 RepID=A0ACC6M7P7_9BACI|nr:flagellar hook-length control protein FliK [Gracilibacillus sp. S3-1-1]MDX8046940.1 flagellar hook-length control protein FliK [Gracilibacillus sp. S3-1-1]